MAKDNKGRHASGGAGAFYRDLAMMVLGILLVGAAVFFILFLVADGPEESTTTAVAQATTTTVAETTSTTSEGTTTSSSSTSSTTSTTIPVRPPEEVRVIVLNSIGLSGAAGRMTTRLDDAGYQTLPADDYAPEQSPSKIWFREGFSTEAAELLEFIPDARVEPLVDDDLAEGADLILVLGTGYEE
jgi:cytoskeletal protein RodZ